MNAETENLINHGANFTVAVLDDNDDEITVDARTLDPARLSACQDAAPDILCAAMFHYVRTGELLYADYVDVWLMQYIGAYADTADGLRDTLAKLTGSQRIPGVDDTLTGQDRLDAWSVHLALFDPVLPWFPFTTDYSWLVDHIEIELDNLADEVTA